MNTYEIKPGFNGLPPIKDQYEENEKILIADAARKYGFKLVVEAYGVRRQLVAAWMKKTKRAEPKKHTEAAPVTTFIIQSPDGKEITPSEVLAKVGNVEKVYVRPDENAAYWVRGEENGAVNLW